MIVRRILAFAAVPALVGLMSGPAHAITKDWCVFAVESHAIEVSEAVVDAYRVAWRVGRSRMRNVAW